MWGFVLVSADDPGCHSSQNEQDNRIFAKFAKVACIEPSDSQESKDFIKEAYKISEAFDVAVLFRMTTRVCHSKGLVAFEEREEREIIPYEKQIQKYIVAPAHAQRLHPIVEDKLKKLEAFSNETHLNVEEWHGSEIGIVTSGVAYTYAREVFKDTANYLKIGFSNPLPMDKIRAFSQKVKTLYVIEELEPFMEDQMKAAGIACIGKEKIPLTGELSPDVIEEAIFGKKPEFLSISEEKIVPRPPTLCAGCPHRGFFYALGKKKNVVVTGDIGCYTLGFADPLNAIDSVHCMGASISMGHGAQKAFKKHGVDKRIVSVIGDSTFLHTGVNSLLTVAYNGGNTVNVILDNRITAMTGHQENPGTGFTLQGAPAKEVNLEELVKAIGIEHVKTINPLKLKEVDTALEEAFAFDGPSVIITRWPCALKRYSEADIEEFGPLENQCHVIEDKCKGCRICTKTGCPAISFDNDKKKAFIDPNQCVGCMVCLQSCPFNAIERVVE